MNHVQDECELSYWWSMVLALDGTSSHYCENMGCFGLPLRCSEQTLFQLPQCEYGGPNGGNDESHVRKMM